MTAGDRPDNGQDKLVWVQLPADDVAFIAGFDPDRDRTASRADMVRVIEHLQTTLTACECWCGPQCPGCSELKASGEWKHATWCTGIPAAAPCPSRSHGADGWHCAVTGPHEQHANAAGDATW